MSRRYINSFQSTHFPVLRLTSSRLRNSSSRQRSHPSNSSLFFLNGAPRRYV
nr:MAG TPA: hypothetical protein [Caudoviricetes sp.]